LSRRHTPVEEDEGRGAFFICADARELFDGAELGRAAHLHDATN
jgi:hypothetical protein